MSESNERVEFIEENPPKPEGKRNYIKDFLDGSLLTRNDVVKQLPFLIFLTFLAIVYIANRYQAEKVVRETSKIQQELKDLRAESMTIKAELMFISKQSTVAKTLSDKGSELKESMVPPKKLAGN